MGDPRMFLSHTAFMVMGGSPKKACNITKNAGFYGICVPLLKKHHANRKVWYEAAQEYGLDLLWEEVPSFLEGPRTPFMRLLHWGKFLFPYMGPERTVFHNNVLVDGYRLIMYGHHAYSDARDNQGILFRTQSLTNYIQNSLWKPYGDFFYAIQHTKSNVAFDVGGMLLWMNGAKTPYDLERAYKEGVFHGQLERSWARLQKQVKVLYINNFLPGWKRFSHTYPNGDGPLAISSFFKNIVKEDFAGDIVVHVPMCFGEPFLHRLYANRLSEARMLVHSWATHNQYTDNVGKTFAGAYQQYHAGGCDVT